MARRRHYRRNPVVSSTLLFVLGGTGILTWLLTRKASAATNPSAVPGSTANCKVKQIQMSDFISLGLQAQAACQAGNKKGCDDALTLGLQVLEMQKQWPVACGPVPAIPQPGTNPSALPGTPENCKVNQIQMSDYISLGLTAQKECAAGNKQACEGALTLGLQVLALQKAWPTACGPVPQVPTL